MIMDAYRYTQIYQVYIQARVTAARELLQRCGSILRVKLSMQVCVHQQRYPVPYKQPCQDTFGCTAAAVAGTSMLPRSHFLVQRFKAQPVRCQHQQHQQYQLCTAHICRGTWCYTISHAKTLSAGEWRGSRYKHATKISSSCAQVLRFKQSTASINTSSASSISCEQLTTAFHAAISRQCKALVCFYYTIQMSSDHDAVTAWATIQLSLSIAIMCVHAFDQLIPETDRRLLR